MNTDLSEALVLSNARESIVALMRAHDRAAELVMRSRCQCSACQSGRSTLALIDARVRGPMKPPGELRVTRHVANSIEAERPGLRVIDGGRA